MWNSGPHTIDGNKDAYNALLQNLIIDFMASLN